MNMFQLTEDIFRAFLHCETKSYFKLSDSVEPLSELIHLQQSLFEKFKQKCQRRLRSRFGDDEFHEGSVLPQNLAKAKDRLLLNCMAETPQIKSRINALERVPTSGNTSNTKHNPYVPIRFVPSEKIADHDKFLLAFDAIALAAASGRTLLVGKIMHGDELATVTVKLLPYIKIAQSIINKITSQQACQTPPPLILNKHCVECGFRVQCRQVALKSDDLSLLSGMPDKERKRLHNRGILSVTQLSYLFRPRRKRRSLASKPDKNSYALRALAIRDNKIHIVGKPELKITGTPVYLDVEGVPDRGCYYLIGILTPSGSSWVRQFFWADEVSDEKEMWNSFLRSVGSIENPQLIHYGGYETTFLKRMKDRYGADSTLPLLTRLIEGSVNVLKVIYAQVYFPTYANGLKEITRYLGFGWSDSAASGINALMWRLKWESSRDPALKEKLITYNAEDCEALEKVTNTVMKLCDAQTGALRSNDYDIVEVDFLRREKAYPLGRNEFAIPELEKINKSAYWDYQRNRIYLRSSPSVKAAVQRADKRPSKPVHVNKTIELRARPACCPKCGAKRIEKHDRHSRVVHDLRFSRSSIKRWVIRYCFHRYICCSCGATFLPVDSPATKSKYGSDLRSYIVYQIIELRIPQTTVEDSLSQLFGLDMGAGAVHLQKTLASRVYEVTYKGILKDLVRGQLLHVDETKISIDGRDAFVWVLASHEAVAYIYTDSREGDMVQELLRDFKGVLVSDFYAAYDSIDCPQQKCLIHLIRDLNEDALKHPFNEELMELVRQFAGLLKPIIETIDRFGLKTRFLRKHKVEVTRYNRLLSTRTYSTEVAIKYQKRFQQSAERLFTFLDYDNVPWNNNNAEHAVKPFAKLRHVICGMSTPKGIREYLVLLSVAETCKYRGVSFLDFLHSGEKNIDDFMKECPR